jgi:hypothetical protein
VIEPDIVFDEPADDLHAMVRCPYYYICHATPAACSATE